MSALRFHDATIRLGRRDILSAASFAIEEGEFIGVLGANGAGKTTLMRAALGLVPVASGAISVFDQPVTRGNAAIGYVPQVHGATAGLRLTGWDVVASAAIGAAPTGSSTGRSSPKRSCARTRIAILRLPAGCSATASMLLFSRFSTTCESATVRQFSLNNLAKTWNLDLIDIG